MRAMGIRALLNALHLRHYIPLVAITQEGQSYAICRHCVRAPGSRHPASQLAGYKADGTDCITASAWQLVKKAIIQGLAIIMRAKASISYPVIYLRV